MKSFVERPRWTCALGGALAAVSALPRTVPIMHAGPGCAANFAWTQNGAAGLQVAGYCGGLSIPGTNLQEREVVFGGVARLEEQIRHTVDLMDGDLYFVLTGCAPEVIGDDVQSVVSDLSGNGHSIVAASTAGFKGDAYHGYEQVLKTLFQKVVATGAPRQANRVNVWGIPPMMDVFWRGNLAGVRQLLALLGFEANLFFGTGETLESIRDASGVRLNIVLSDLYGVEAAELFRERHGVDYVTTPLPIGAAASERFLREIGIRLGVETKEIDRIIQQEGTRHYEYLEPFVDVYNDMEAQRYAIVLGDSNYAFSLADFLSEDLGWLPQRVVITDALTEEKQKHLLAKRKERDLRDYPEVLFENSSVRILESVDDRWRPENWKKYHPALLPAFVLGSSLDRELAATLGAGHLSVSFPVSNRVVLNRGYTGFDGGLRLTEDVVSSIILMR